MKPTSAQMPLRLPVSLHHLLKEMADKEGVSLNQYCLYLLAKYSGGEHNLQREKAESLLKFLEEAQVFQREMKSPVRGFQEERVQETPFERWKRLYEKN